MRVFVYEFITGGGFARQPLPEGLAREGELMAQILVHELAALPGIEVWAARDRRLPPLGARARTVFLDPREAPLDGYRKVLQECDAAWPVAPETGGTLEALSRATLDAGKVLLGSRPDAVALTASKRTAAALLAAAGVAVVPTFGAEPLPELPGAWVVKPEDGAGCVDTLRLPDADSARQWLRTRKGFVAQPWIEGEALSLSALFADGRALLLSINRQQVDVHGGNMELEELMVNALQDTAGRFAQLAADVARALPGLWGYAGIDLVDGTAGAVVMEVNPRLTTSYCALGEALGVNVAGLVLKLLASGELPAPLPGLRPVQVPLEPVHA